MKTETGTTRRSALRGCGLAAFVAALAAMGTALAGTDAAAQDVAQGPIVMVAGDLIDPFFGALKRGADDAARDLGVNYTYLAAELNAADLARAIESAAATNPAGLAFGDWFPETQDPLVLKLAQEGTPVVGFNSGPENWRESTGALAWVSQSDKAAGVMAGERLAQAGVRHTLCIDHLPGTVLNEQRCSGLAKAMAAAGGTSSVLSIPWSDATNPAKVMQAIQGSLNANNKIARLSDLAKDYAPEAIEALVRIMRNKEATDSAVVAAVNAILDRGYGKPVQALEHAGVDGGPIKFETGLSDELERRLIVATGIALVRSEEDGNVH